MDESVEFRLQRRRRRVSAQICRYRSMSNSTGSISSLVEVMDKVVDDARAVEEKRDSEMKADETAGKVEAPPSWEELRDRAELLKRLISELEFADEDASEEQQALQQQVQNWQLQYNHQFSR